MHGNAHKLVFNTAHCGSILPQALVDRHTRETLDVFLRENAHLKALYKLYAALGEPAEGDTSFSMSLRQMWSCADECQIFSLAHTRTDMDEALLAAWRKTHAPPPLHLRDVDDPHEGGRRGE